MYSFINGSVTKLVNLCTDYEQLENGKLDMGMYMKADQQAQVYSEAMGKLAAIQKQCGTALGLMGTDKAYDKVVSLVTEIQQYAASDYKTFQGKVAEANNQMLNAYNKAFRLGNYYNPYAEYPGEYITADAFKVANAAGILNLQMVKWWRTKEYSGFNAEINVFVSGNLWAIAHVKWDPKSSPFEMKDDPKYYNFKAPNNASFPGEQSMIKDDTVQIYLLGQCLKFKDNTEVPWGMYERERFV